MPLRNKDAKDKDDRETEDGGLLQIFMILLTAGVTLLEAVSGRYLIACLFGVLLVISVVAAWRQS